MGSNSCRKQKTLCGRLVWRLWDLVCLLFYNRFYITLLLCNKIFRVSKKINSSIYSIHNRLHIFKILEQLTVQWREFNSKIRFLWVFFIVFSCHNVWLLKSVLHKTQRSRKHTKNRQRILTNNNLVY